MTTKLSASQEALENFIQTEERPRASARRTAAASAAEQSARNIAAVSGKGAQDVGEQTQESGQNTGLGKAVAEGADAAVKVGEAAQEQAGKVTDWAAALPTPGGILLLVVVLLIFVWILVPVNNGLTRAQLAYLTIMGKTKLVGNQGIPPTTNQPSAPVFGMLSEIVPQGGNVSQPTTTSVTSTDPYAQPGAIQALSNVNGTGYIPDFGTTM